MTSALTSMNMEGQPSHAPEALPKRALSLFHGDSRMPRFSHYFLPRILSNGERVLYLDGANQIDPLLIARFARERGCEAASFNRLIRISRAFTCFQLTELIKRAPLFLEKFEASVVIVTALPDIYFDEDIRDAAACATFQHALEGLRHLSGQPLSVVVFSDAASFRSNRRNFFQQLTTQADQVIKVESQPENKLAFTYEKTKPLLSA